MKSLLLSLCLFPVALFATPEIHPFQAETGSLLEMLAQKETIPGCAAKYEYLKQLAHADLYAESYTNSPQGEAWTMVAIRPGTAPVGLIPAQEVGRLSFVKREVVGAPWVADSPQPSQVTCEYGGAPFVGEVTKFDVYTNYLLSALKLCPREYYQLAHSGYTVVPVAYSYEPHLRSTYTLKTVLYGSPLSGLGPQDEGSLTISQNYLGAGPADGPAPYRLSCDLH